MKKELLRIDHLSKKNSEGTLSLEDVSFQVFAGEIFGLICADNIDKEEIIRVLFQNIPISYGAVYINEQLVISYRNSSGTRNAIAIIDHVNRLVDGLTVADNVFVLRSGFRKYLIRSQTLDAQLAGFCKKLGVTIRGEDMLESLSAFEKCVVELLKAMVAGVHLIVVKDLSNLLGAADLLRFQELLQELTNDGYGILYICDHHEEAFAISDRAALMIDASIAWIREKQEFDENLIWRYMLKFRDFEKIQHTVTKKKQAISIEKLYYGAIRGLDLTVRAGECVTVVDVDNKIFSDLVNVASGQAVPQSGRIVVAGQEILPRSKWQNIAVIQQSPTQTMIFSEMTIMDNLCFLAGEKWPRIWTDQKIRANIAHEYKQYAPEALAANSRLEGLSATGLLDIVYARVHLANPAVCICVQPFFGADMHMRRHILEWIKTLCEKNMALILLLVNLSDSLMIAEQLYLLSDGKVAQIYESDAFTVFGSKSIPQKSIRSE